MWKHWVARAWVPYEPFNDFESAAWFWEKLGKAFPEMISAVLMPNHLHLILPQEVVNSRRLAGLLAAMSVRSGLKNLWQPIPCPTEILDRYHLRRQIRYVALNPCRKQLCADPLEWFWSTYREYVGAVVGATGSGQRIAHILSESPRDFEVRFHLYVSGDPSVSITGTPFPIPASPKAFPEQSIGEILAAAAGALRKKPSAVQERGPLRPLFIHLAYRHGWRRPIYLAQICQITPGGVHEILNTGRSTGIEAAELCLGDVRLRRARDGGVGFLTETKENAGTKAWSRRFL